MMKKTILLTAILTVFAALTAQAEIPISLNNPKTLKEAAKAGREDLIIAFTTANNYTLVEFVEAFDRDYDYVRDLMAKVMPR
jgi:hypothetical protein